MTGPAPADHSWEGGPDRRNGVRLRTRRAVLVSIGLLVAGMVVAGMVAVAARGTDTAPAEIVATPPAAAPAPTSVSEPVTPAALREIAGAWSPVDLPGPVSDAGVQSAAWTGEALVLADGPSVHVQRAGRSGWDPSPDLPADAVLAGAQLTSVGDALVVVAQRRRTAPAGAALPYAWVLGEDGWTAADGGPGFATPLGVADGRLVVQDDVDGEEGLWALEPDPLGWSPLPDPPAEMTGLHAADVGGQLLLLGLATPDSGPGRPAAALLQGDAWEVLAEPPAVLYGTPAVADGTVVGTVQLPGGVPAIALLDVAANRWSTLPVPVEGDGAAIGYPPAAWDGADTVWFHGGLGTTVHLALALSTRQLSSAQAGSDEVGPLVWDGAGLLRWGYGLTGPFGVHRWTPAG